MSAVRVEIDTCDLAVSIRAILVALEKKVRAVVVVGVSTFLIVQDEVGIFVRLSLRRFDFVARRGQVARRGNRRAVVAVAVVALIARVFELERALSGDRFNQLRRENIWSGHAKGPGIGGTDRSDSAWLSVGPVAFVSEGRRSRQKT